MTARFTYHRRRRHCYLKFRQKQFAERQQNHTRHHTAPDKHSPARVTAKESEMEHPSSTEQQRHLEQYDDRRRQFRQTSQQGRQDTSPPLRSGLCVGDYLRGNPAQLLDLLLRELLGLDQLRDQVGRRASCENVGHTLRHVLENASA